MTGRECTIMDYRRCSQNGSKLALFSSQVHTDRTKFDIVVKQVGPRMQEVMWVPAIDTKTFCNLDYTYWPWDVQYCKYSVGSWTAFDDQVVVNMMRNVRLTSHHLPHSHGSKIQTF